jgi:hypothetical protein
LWTFFGISTDGTISTAQVLSIDHGARNVQKMLDPNNILQRYLQAGFVRAALLANLPQLVLSVMYMAFNRVLTTLILSMEVNDFSIRPKGLRVSSVPRGAQRSEYFLGLPYRYALSFMLLAGIMHWLCSQSFFFVSIFEASAVSGENRNDTSASDSKEVLTLGYSPFAIIVLAVLVVVMYAVVITCGLRRLPTKMPLSGSCSAVLSAMCHQPASENGDEAVLRPLMWGVSSEHGQYGVGTVECSFSSRAARQPDFDDAIITWGYVPRARPRAYFYI